MPKVIKLLSYDIPRLRGYSNSLKKLYFLKLLKFSCLFLGTPMRNPVASPALDGSDGRIQVEAAQSKILNTGPLFAKLVSRLTLVLRGPLTFG